MVRFQPPLVPASRPDRPHLFAAPVDDDDEEEGQRVVSDAGEEEEEEVDEDEGLYEGKYDEDEEQPSIYPKLSDDGGQAHLRSRRAIPADGDDDDAMLERADHYGRDALAMDITLASRNDRQQLVRAAPSKKRFVAEDVDEEVKAEEEARPAPPSIPSYLLTHSALLTPGTHTASSSDPAISLSSALSALPPPPSSTLPSASPIAGVSDRATGWRKAFRVGWGVDGRVAVVEGGKVTITQVRGDEQSKGKPRDVIERERKGRAEMRLRLLQVHLDFSEAQRSGALHSNGDVKGSAQSSSSAFPPLSAGRAAASSSTGSLATSTSPLAILCDRYTAALTPLLPSFPLPSSSSSSPSSFCFARQLRQAISVFQLVKLLFALEYGSASLSSLLPGLPSPSPSSAPSASSSSLSSPSTSSYGERYARLQHLIRFLQEELSSPLHPPPRTHSPSYPPLFPLLSSFQIPQATEAALSTNHLRLATLLPSLSALSSTFTPLILSQVSDWKNSGVWDVMEEDERRVWKLMAGDLQTEGMDWLRGLAMHIFYQEEGKGDVREGVKRYWQAMQAGKARPPSPPYVTEEKQPPPPSKPRRRRIADNNEDDDVAMNGDHRLLPPPAKPHQDTRFALLAVYAGLTTDLSGLFSPSSSTPDLLDHSLAFHLHHALTFSTLIPYSNYHHTLTSYASQLENDGQWGWAVYVLHQTQHINRRHRIDIHHAHLAQLIIERHATAPHTASFLIAPHSTHIALQRNRNPPPPASPTQQFITSHTSTPLATFHRAHALSAAYSFDPLIALLRYLDASEWHSAHAMLVGGGVAAAWVLLGEWERLAEVLHQLTTHQREIGNWSEEGGLYLEFVRVRRAMEGGKGEEVTREKGSLMELIDRLTESSQASRRGGADGGSRVDGRSVESLLHATALTAMVEDCEQWRARHFS